MFYELHSITASYTLIFDMIKHGINKSKQLLSWVQPHRAAGWAVDSSFWSILPRSRPLRFVSCPLGGGLTPRLRTIKLIYPTVYKVVATSFTMKYYLLLLKQDLTEEVFDYSHGFCTTVKNLGVSSTFVFAELSAAFHPIHEWFTVECFGGELCSLQWK